MTVLPAMCIDVETRQRRKRHRSRYATREQTAMSSCPSMTEPDAQQSKILSDFNFDSRTRKNVKNDVQTVLHGFVLWHDLLEEFQIPRHSLCCWINAIATQYLKVPYHNWQHAFDVFQFTCLGLWEGGACQFFNYDDLLALLLATIAHDVGHEGTNNAFLVKTGHRIAMTYNDISPLENMHASKCFETLHKPGFNFLETLPSEQVSGIRRSVIDAILATDMAHHFEFVDRFTARVSAKESQPFAPAMPSDMDEAASATDRRMLMQAFIHMSDLGHCCRPWQVHKHAVMRLEEEFFQQGDRERELGVDIMPLMNRHSDSAAVAQDFFLEKMVKPLLLPFCHFLSSEFSDLMREDLEGNKVRWNALVDRHGKLAATQLVPLDDTTIIFPVPL